MIYLNGFIALIKAIDLAKRYFVTKSMTPIAVQGIILNTSAVPLQVLLRKANASLKSTSNTYIEQWYNLVHIETNDNEIMKVLVSINNKDYEFFDTSDKTYSYNDSDFSLNDAVDMVIYEYNSEYYMSEELRDELYRI